MSEEGTEASQRRSVIKMKYYTYILECADKSFYVGCTNNLEKRIKQHNKSKCGAHYTKIRRPVELKYFETFNNLKSARRREAEIKKWNRIKKLEFMKESGTNKSNQIGTEINRS